MVCYLGATQQDRLARRSTRCVRGAHGVVGVDRRLGGAGVDVAERAAPRSGQGAGAFVVVPCCRIEHANRADRDAIGGGC